MNRENWLKCIDIATTLHRKPTKRDILAVAKLHYGEDMAAESAAAADRGHLRDLADVMRSAADPTEEGTGEIEQLPLPGLPAPGYLLVRGQDGLTVVKYRRAVRPERHAAIEERRRARDRIDGRIEDLLEKEAFLAPFTPDDNTTVEQAIERMQKDAPKRPSGSPRNETEPASERVDEHV